MDAMCIRTSFPRQQGRPRLHWLNRLVGQRSNQQRLLSSRWNGKKWREEKRFAFKRPLLTKLHWLVRSRAPAESFDVAKVLTKLRWLVRSIAPAESFEVVKVLTKLRWLVRSRAPAESFEVVKEGSIKAEAPDKESLIDQCYLSPLLPVRRQLPLGSTEQAALFWADFHGKMLRPAEASVGGSDH